MFLRSISFLICISRSYSAMRESFYNSVNFHNYTMELSTMVAAFYNTISVSGIVQFGLAMGILARLRLAKIRTMARPNSPDMPPKRAKKVRLGIFNVQFAFSISRLLIITSWNCRWCNEVWIVNFIGWAGTTSLTTNAILNVQKHLKSK